MKRREVDHTETIDSASKRQEREVDEDEPPLIKAVGKKDIVAIAKLLDDGADLNTRTRWGGDTPLHVACSVGCTEVAEVLLRKKADPNKVNYFGSTPLALPCHYAYTGTIEILLSYGADPNKGDQYGNTPLAAACKMGHKNVVEILLRAGANPNKGPSLDGSLLGTICSSYAELEISVLDVQLIQQRRDAYVEIAQMLLRAGANPNIPDIMKRTPLIWACNTAEKKMAEVLLRAHADVDKTDMYRGTALIYAYAKGNGAKDAIKRVYKNAGLTFLLHVQQNCPAGLLQGFGEITRYIVDMSMPVEMQRNYALP